MDDAITPANQLIRTIPLSQNAAAVYLARLTSDLSKRTMRAALDKIADLDGQDAFTLNWAALRYQHTLAIRAHLATSYAPATANKLLSALRGVLKEAWRLGQMSAEDYQRAVDVENFETESGKIIIRGGKGNKDRTVYATNGALDALLDWLAVRGTHPGALFVPINKGGIVQYGKSMSAQAVYKLLVKRGAEGGVKEFSAHDFRRTFVGDLLDWGVDIATVAKLAGHSDVKTTARYDRRPETTKRNAAGKLHYPYHRRSSQ